MGIDQGHKGLNSKLKRDIHFSPELVIVTVVNALRSPKMQQEESVLLINLVLHYVKKINFTTYKSLIDDFIRDVNNTYIHTLFVPNGLFGIKR